MTVNAHYDGKVLIPDKPLDLPLNQAVVVQIEAVLDEADEGVESSLTWIAENAVEVDPLPADLAANHDHYLYGGPGIQRMEP
jgi:hypothetical protein